MPVEKRYSRVSGTPESQHLEIYNALKVKDLLKRNKQSIHLRFSEHLNFKSAHLGGCLELQAESWAKLH